MSDSLIIVVIGVVLLFDNSNFIFLEVVLLRQSHGKSARNCPLFFLTVRHHFPGFFPFKWPYYSGSRQELSVHSYVSYFWRLAIVFRTILDKNHLCGWSVHPQPNRGATPSYPGANMEFLFVESFPIHLKNRNGQIYLQVMKQNMVYRA